jgi:alkaline phosphatase
MRMLTRTLIFAAILPLISVAQTPVPPATGARSEPGNAIFIHPDGVGANTWAALRMLTVGPDGNLNWDRMERMGVYRGHMTDRLSASSNGGATAHAYGVRPTGGAFGLDEGRQLVAASGRPMPLGREALAAGLAVGIVNSASVSDAGTGVFMASVTRRSEHAEIVSQMLAAGPQVILGGGESHFLPTGARGRHGEGLRTDGRNLIEEARAAGYVVVYTAEELRTALAQRPTRLLGLFAADDTFHDQSEEELARTGRPMFIPTAPAFDEMVQAAIQVLDASGNRFLLVAEEEATDNFGGANNAKGVLEALARADRALGAAMRYAERQGRTLVLTAADSDAGGMQVVGALGFREDRNLPANDAENGAPIDGREGTGTPPFMAAPDANGRRLPFAIAWAGAWDLYGGVIARAHGFRADRLPTVVNNTDIYNLLYEALFGHGPRTPAPAPVPN